MESSPSYTSTKIDNTVGRSAVRAAGAGVYILPRHARLQERPIGERLQQLAHGAGPSRRKHLRDRSEQQPIREALKASLCVRYFSFTSIAATENRWFEEYTAIRCALEQNEALPESYVWCHLY